MNLIHPAPVNLGLGTIQRLGHLLSSLTASGPTHSLPPNVRSGFLSKAEAVLGEIPLTPARATVAPIGRAAYGYLFRLPEDPEPFSRLVMPSNRSHSGTLEIQPGPGYVNPLAVALYYVFPEADRPMLRHYIRLSSFFCGVSQTNAFAEVQPIKTDTEPHQALMLLLGAMETLDTRRFSDKPPASETRAKRGPKPRTGTEP